MRMKAGCSCCELSLTRRGFLAASAAALPALPMSERKIIARRAAFGLQRKGDDSVAGLPVRGDVGREPPREVPVEPAQPLDFAVGLGPAVGG